jgi:hypothetical protein
MKQGKTEPFCCSARLEPNIFYTNPMIRNQLTELTTLYDHCKDMSIQDFVLANWQLSNVAITKTVHLDADKWLQKR